MIPIRLPTRANRSSHDNKDFHIAESLAPGGTPETGTGFPRVTIPRILVSLKACEQRRLRRRRSSWHRERACPLFLNGENGAPNCGRCALQAWNAFSPSHQGHSCRSARFGGTPSAVWHAIGNVSYRQRAAPVTEFPGLRPPSRADRRIPPGEGALEEVEDHVKRRLSAEYRDASASGPGHGLRAAHRFAGFCCGTAGPGRGPHLPVQPVAPASLAAGKNVAVFLPLCCPSPACFCTFWTSHPAPSSHVLRAPCANKAGRVLELHPSRIW